MLLALSTIFLYKSFLSGKLPIKNSKENLDYAVVMFSDWNQVAFNNGSNVKYFNLNPNEKQIFELTLPDINESSLFQVIAFPMPYKITSPTSYDGSLAYGSFKFILEP